MRSRLAFVLGICLLFPAGAGAAKTPLPSFRSPSGNIRCFDAVVLHCAIAQADYAKTLQNRCITGPGVDWHGFELSATGKGVITCSGGILYNPEHADAALSDAGVREDVAAGRVHLRIGGDRRDLPQPRRAWAVRLPAVLARFSEVSSKHPLEVAAKPH